jgi:23S rRNA (cytidine1920-2'-O)/16S rRNA (cytidine1409-2'-O)-methyltransferase
LRRKQPLALLEHLRRHRPDLSDPAEAIRKGRVRVDGAIVTNPRSQVRPASSVAVVSERELHGTLKLRAALAAFGVAVDGRVALDLGAAAGGFAVALLEAGAARVYAVDAGHGQLLGSLRQDPRVVNLEATNLAELSAALVPEPVGLVTADLSYLSLASALGQLAVALAPGAELVALVKPMFELAVAAPPADRASLELSVARAVEGATAAGWSVAATVESPVRGWRGAIEFFIHARRG